MSDQFLLIVIGIIVVAFAVIVAVYLQMAKKMQKSEYQKLKKLQEGTKAKTFTMEILYQKLYIRYIRIPFLKRYMQKLRRRLEILNMDDEYKTRKDTAKILTNVLLILFPLTAATIAITKDNYLLLSILLVFEVFIIDSFIDSSIDKRDDQLLKEQLDFFSEIRHAYNESNMVDEAIYEISQDDERSISSQGEKIYEILISDDPETELEKYYDVAPNVFLKEFAGLSYLTKEFGDRKVNGASLYLKNINNITQEMQLEILKRSKLNYVFKSLPIISIAPMLMLEPIKEWSVENFAFTKSWYYGKAGMIVQILILIITFVSYLLVRKLKDSGGTKGDIAVLDNPWQKKLLKNKLFDRIVKSFMPKKGVTEYKKLQKLLKDSASQLKMEWVYVNRLVAAVITFFVSIMFFMLLHNIAKDYIYTEPTTEYDLMMAQSEKEEEISMEVTRLDNIILDMYVGKLGTTEDEILYYVNRSPDYEGYSNLEKQAVVTRVKEKLDTINSEYLKWFEILMAFAFSIVGYMIPIWFLVFQCKMRQIEMEDEVMQFQTIILMLMRIERINVEIILEWLERYANIFKPQITKCMNNYEAGAWKALEEMRDEVTYVQFIRLIESMQAAVERIPIVDAFDELDSERDYYREKRKESNERLVSTKALVGKVIGFTPMVVTFVGYLIIPLVFIGLTSMSTTMTTMMSM